MPGQVPVGISDIAIYLPKQKIDLLKVIEMRSEQEDGLKVSKLLKRALHKTGLTTLHFPKKWEDPVTMAAEAAYQLINRQGFALSKLRYLVSGTETAVDHSKPIAAYVTGMLKKVGVPIPQSISTFQTQHACAGGTVALLGISALLGIVGPKEESGIVLCSDIARYEPSTSAEVTQGAGAVAILTETYPKLIALDLHTVGYCSNDVDDFFRPLGSETARVKGTYSIHCYKEAMESAFFDHAERVGKTIREVLTETDMFALHVPYPTLPTETMYYLLEKHAGMTQEEITPFLEKRGFFAMTSPASRAGNIYSGSLFLSLAFLLKQQFEQYGQALVGKRILLASYGSGNTMALIAGTITEKAPETIAKWDLEGIWSKESADFAAYESWLSSSGEEKVPHLPGTFYLDNIREDGYREYLFKE